LDRNPISLGESATLTITVEGGELQGQPSLSPVSGLEYGGASTQTQMQFDGATCRAKPASPLMYIPPEKAISPSLPFQATVDGKRMASRSIQLRVVKGNLPDSPDKLEAAFVGSSPHHTIYAGQVVPVEIRCYCQAASGVQPPQLTSEDFTIGNMPGFSGRAPQVNIRGTPYNFLSFHVPISPPKPAPSPSPRQLEPDPRHPLRYFWQSHCRETR